MNTLELNSISTSSAGVRGTTRRSAQRYPFCFDVQTMHLNNRHLILTVRKDQRKEKNHWTNPLSWYTDRFFLRWYFDMKWKNKRTETKGALSRTSERRRETDRQTDRQWIPVIKIIKLKGWEEEELTGYLLTPRENWRLDHKEFDPSWFRNSRDHWHSIVISLSDVHRDHDLHQHLVDGSDWQRH